MTYSNELLKKMKKAYGADCKWTLCCEYGVKISTDIMESELISFNKGWKRYLQSLPYDNVIEKAKAIKLYHSFAATAERRAEVIRLINYENRSFERMIEREEVCME